MIIYRRVILPLLLLACAPPQARDVGIANEGIQSPEGPPRLHAARSADPTLLSRRESALVVRTVACCGYGIPNVQVQLFLNEWWEKAIRTDSTRSDGMIVLRGLTPGNYTGLARRVGLKQQLFRVSLVSGHVDTLELQLGTAGQ